VKPDQEQRNGNVVANIETGVKEHKEHNHGEEILDFVVSEKENAFQVRL
jgi:hypothetical protein